MTAVPKDPASGRWFCVLAVTAMWLGLWPAPVRAGDAQSRATAYQAAIREVLTTRKWKVSSDKAGRLVANSRVYPRGAQLQALIYVPTLAQLTVVLTPRSATFTKCEASIVAFYDGRRTPPAILRQWTGDPDAKQGIIGPKPLNDEDYTKEIQNIVATAEKQLVKAHPEYGAR